MSLHYLVLGWHRKNPPSIFRGMDSSSAGPSVWDLGQNQSPGDRHLKCFGKHLQEMCHHKKCLPIKKKHIELVAWGLAVAFRESQVNIPFNSIKRLGQLELGTSHMIHMAVPRGSNQKGFHGRATDPNKALCLSEGFLLCCPHRMEMNEIRHLLLCHQFSKPG